MTDNPTTPDLTARRVAQFRVVCSVHGDVTGFSITACLIRPDQQFARGYCFECVGEALDNLGVPQVQGEWK